MSFSKTYIFINSSISWIDVMLFILKLLTIISLLFFLNSDKVILFNICFSFIIKSFFLFKVWNSSWYDNITIKGFNSGKLSYKILLRNDIVYLSTKWVSSITNIKGISIFVFFKMFICFLYKINRSIKKLIMWISCFMSMFEK